MSSTSSKPILLIVGAFPKKRTSFGGILTTCDVLINSCIHDYFTLLLIDSTQASNPPPGFFKRFILSTNRFRKFFFSLFCSRPTAILLFTSFGFSVLEKGVMAWFGRIFSAKVFIFPRGGHLIDSSNSSRAKCLLYRCLFHGAHYFLCQGKTWNSFAIDSLGFHESNTFIVENWTATPSFLGIGGRRQFYNYNHKPLNLLFVGWLELEKGIHELLSAFHELSLDFDIRLLIAGRGNAEVAAQSFVQTHGLSHQVEFLGWIDGNSKQEYFQKSDIFVLPSWSEGFPNSLIEAMACKVPAVTTSVGNIADYIVDGEHALVVPPKDPVALTSALRKCISQPLLRELLANNAYKLTTQTFSSDIGIRRLSSFILSKI